MPRASLYDPANATVSWVEAEEASELTGLKPIELATFRPARHALHHVLIRVTVETHVPDGPNYADLGINLRTTAADILETEVAPRLLEISKEFDALGAKARAIIEQELATRIYDVPPPPEPLGFFARLTGRAAPAATVPTRDERALAACTFWSAGDGDNALTAACHAALARTVGAVLGRRGALVIPKDILATIATNLVLNDQGGDLVGAHVAPLFDRAVKRMGLYRLPAQAEPVVLNGKGASASGKSSIRSKQRLIAEHLGLDWRDFAVISPDYWRKQLIDYDGLGDDYKYAAMLTGQELEIIDRKLDSLMAEKAKSGQVPHMLIDRFRFDSFLTARSRAKDSKLLTRFGARVFLFFLITPPEETVLRAWSRGLETGRYKAVDDLLFHNVEAYSGMPDFFLSWATNESRWVHYEFLDNSVPPGETPRTVAYGQNGRLVIRDLACFCNVERYKHINLSATGAEEIFSKALDTEAAMSIVRKLVDQLAGIEVLEARGDRVVARAQDGTWTVDAGAMPETFPASVFGDSVVTENALGRSDPELLKYLIGS